MLKVLVPLALAGLLAACSTTSPDVIARSDAGRLSSVQSGTVEAVRGGVLGNAIERNSNREEALEIVVRLPDGGRQAVVQAKGAEAFKPGDAVTIVFTGTRARVTLAQRAAEEGS